MGSEARRPPTRFFFYVLETRTHDPHEVLKRRTGVHVLFTRRRIRNSGEVDGSTGILTDLDRVRTCVAGAIDVDCPSARSNEIFVFYGQPIHTGGSRKQPDLCSHGRTWLVVDLGIGRIDVSDDGSKGYSEATLQDGVASPARRAADIQQFLGDHDQRVIQRLEDVDPSPAADLAKR